MPLLTDAQPIRVISVMQPWADWLCPNKLVADALHASDPTLAGYLPKDVENRSSGTKHRGLLAIQAMLTVDQQVMNDHGLDPAKFLRGYVVGVVDLDDVVTDSRSPWAQAGRSHWKVSNHRRLLSPIEMRGHQGIRDATAALAAEIRRQLNGELFTTLASS